MIFKQESCAQELYDGMQKAQDKTIIEDNNNNNQLFLEAMHELNSAAECFEKAGRVSRAKEITQVMISLAEDNSDNSKESDDDEVRRVFMFFGFSPEDLENLKNK